MIYPWHQATWNHLQQLTERLPHAILFYGNAGVGKAQFAESFAQALLCEQITSEGVACGQCVSCGWFSQYSHPDYRRVRPEALESETAGDGEELAETEDTKTTAKSSRAPSKEIKIDQIRALSNFLSVSTHRQGYRVVLLYPAEALNIAAANSLLKILEEPPSGTVFLLVASSLDSLLPTIISRCRKIALPTPSYDTAMDWLTTQGVDEADSLLAENGGAPLAALASAQNAESRELLKELLGFLSRPSVEEALRVSERLQKAPVPELVTWQQRWLYDVFSLKFSGRIRYYPKYREQLSQLAARVSTFDLARALKDCAERRAVAAHPLSPKLFIEDMLLGYSSILPR